MSLSQRVAGWLAVQVEELYVSKRRSLEQKAAKLEQAKAHHQVSLRGGCSASSSCTYPHPGSIPQPRSWRLHTKVWLMVSCLLAGVVIMHGAVVAPCMGWDQSLLEEQRRYFKAVKDFQVRAGRGGGPSNNGDRGGVSAPNGGASMGLSP